MKHRQTDVNVINVTKSVIYKREHKWSVMCENVWKTKCYIKEMNKVNTHI